MVNKTTQNKISTAKKVQSFQEERSRPCQGIQFKKRRQSTLQRQLQKQHHPHLQRCQQNRF